MGFFSFISTWTDPSASVKLTKDPKYPSIVPVENTPCLKTINHPNNLDSLANPKGKSRYDMSIDMSRRLAADSNSLRWSFLRGIDVTMIPFTATSLKLGVVTENSLRKIISQTKVSYGDVKIVKLKNTKESTYWHKLFTHTDKRKPFSSRYEVKSPQVGKRREIQITDNIEEVTNGPSIVQCIGTDSGERRHYLNKLFNLFKSHSSEKTVNLSTTSSLQNPMPTQATSVAIPSIFGSKRTRGRTTKAFVTLCGMLLLRRPKETIEISSNVQSEADVVDAQCSHTSVDRSISTANSFRPKTPSGQIIGKRHHSDYRLDVPQAPFVMRQHSFGSHTKDLNCEESPTKECQRGKIVRVFKTHVSHPIAARTNMSQNQDQVGYKISKELNIDPESPFLTLYSTNQSNGSLWVRLMQLKCHLDERDEHPHDIGPTHRNNFGRSLTQVKLILNTWPEEATHVINEYQYIRHLPGDHYPRSIYTPIDPSKDSRRSAANLSYKLRRALDTKCILEENYYDSDTCALQEYIHSDLYSGGEMLLDDTSSTPVPLLPIRSGELRLLRRQQCQVVLPTRSMDRLNLETSYKTSKWPSIYSSNSGNLYCATMSSPIAGWWSSSKKYNIENHHFVKFPFASKGPFIGYHRKQANKITSEQQLLINRVTLGTSAIVDSLPLIERVKLLLKESTSEGTSSPSSSSLAHSIDTLKSNINEEKSMQLFSSVDSSSKGCDQIFESQPQTKIGNQVTKSRCRSHSSILSGDVNSGGSESQQGGLVYDMFPTPFQKPSWFVDFPRNTSNSVSKANIDAEKYGAPVITCNSIATGHETKENPEPSQSHLDKNIKCTMGISNDDNELVMASSFPFNHNQHIYSQKATESGQLSGRDIKLSDISSKAKSSSGELSSVSTESIVVVNSNKSALSLVPFKRHLEEHSLSSDHLERQPKELVTKRFPKRVTSGFSEIRSEPSRHPGFPPDWYKGKGLKLNIDFPNQILIDQSVVSIYDSLNHIINPQLSSISSSFMGCCNESELAKSNHIFGDVDQVQSSRSI
ncbi:uncharacterized protein RJT20DRAFT_136570 [Scheffersomyces xylosifermentans]|uniref:uncharacterized protein n=1 Tax=Scheffersomyces xylosifermentans TaxID=1304137 RepID=UPI00315CFFC9